MSCFQWGEAVNSSLRGLSADAMQQPFSQSKLIHLRVKGVRQRGCKVDIRDVQSTLGRSRFRENIRPNNNNNKQQKAGGRLCFTTGAAAPCGGGCDLGQGALRARAKRPDIPSLEPP
jgi:hypothetical protein